MVFMKYTLTSEVKHFYNRKSFEIVQFILHKYIS